MYNVACGLIYSLMRVRIMMFEFEFLDMPFDYICSASKQAYFTFVFLQNSCSGNLMMKE